MYFGTYAGLLLGAFVGRRIPNFNKPLYWALILFLYLFVAFRFEVGCDWGGYLRNYYFPVATTYGETLLTLEPGHWALILLLQEFGARYQALNAITAGFFFVGLHALARRQPDPLAFLVLCFPILIINMPMSGIRQAAAIGFLCFSFGALIDKKPLNFVVWTLLGSLFHASCIVFLVLTPFVWGKFNRINVIVAIILALPGLYVLSQTGAATLAEQRYIDSELSAAGAVYRLGLLSISGLFFLLILAPAWRDKFPTDYKLATIGSWMMIAFFGLFFISTVIGDRFGYYLIPIQAMIFARIPSLSLGANRIFYSILPYVALSLVFLIWIRFSWHFNECYVPYQFSFG